MEAQFTSMQAAQQDLVKMMSLLMQLLAPMNEGNPQFALLGELLQSMTTRLTANQDSMKTLWEAHTSSVAEKEPEFQERKTVPKAVAAAPSMVFGARPQGSPSSTQWKDIVKTKRSKRLAAEQVIAQARQEQICQERTICLTIKGATWKSIASIGADLERWLRTRMTIQVSGKLLENIRMGRTDRVYIQISSTIWDAANKAIQQQRTFILPSTQLQCEYTTIEPSPYAGMKRFVLSGVRFDVNLEADFLEELIESNPDLQLTTQDIGTKIKNPRRLKRRVQGPALTWQDSLAVEFWVTDDIATVLTSKKTLTWEWSILALKPYKQAPQVCFNCQRPGHISSQCRSHPRCRHCDDMHESRSCPRHPTVMKLHDRARSVKRAHTTQPYAPEWLGVNLAAASSRQHTRPPDQTSTADDSEMKDDNGQP